MQNNLDQESWGMQVAGTHCDLEVKLMRLFGGGKRGGGVWVGSHWDGGAGRGLVSADAQTAS